MSGPEGDEPLALGWVGAPAVGRAALDRARRGEPRERLHLEAVGDEEGRGLPREPAVVRAPDAPAPAVSDAAGRERDEGAHVSFETRVGGVGSLLPARAAVVGEPEPVAGEEAAGEGVARRRLEEAVGVVGPAGLAERGRAVDVHPGVSGVERARDRGALAAEQRVAADDKDRLSATAEAEVSPSAGGWAGRNWHQTIRLAPSFAKDDSIGAHVEGSEVEGLVADLLPGERPGAGRGKALRAGRERQRRRNCDGEEKPHRFC